MTVSTHTYAAAIAGNPLKVRGGSLALDAGSAPHVRGDLELALPGTWSGVDARVGSNLVEGSDFEDPALIPWELTDPTMVTSTTSPHSGLRRLSINPGSGGVKTARSLKTFPAHEGDRYYIEFWATRTSAFNGTATNSKLSVRNAETGAQITPLDFALASLPTANVWTLRTRTFAIPAGVTSIYFDIRADHTAGQVSLDDIVIQRFVAVPTWTPNPTIYDMLDPRASPAPRVLVTAQKDTETPRSFNLHVRERAIDHRAGTVRLSLASDEGLLTDYAPLTDDLTPFSLSGSLRAVTNYVLGVVVPGTSLDAVPATDAAMTPVWSVTNLIVNPSCASASNWYMQGGTFANNSGTGAVGVGFQRCTMTAASAQMFSHNTATINNAPVIRQGSPFTYSIHSRLVSGASMTARAVAYCWDSNGAMLSLITGGPKTKTTAEWERYTVTVRNPPPGTVRVSGYLQVNAASGVQFDVDGAQLAEGSFVVPYFDGNTANTSTYSYAWTGTVAASTSIRTALIAGPDPDAFIWEAGVSALDFLHPLLQAQGLRLVCDEARRWTIRNEAYQASGALALREGINIIEANDDVSRDDGYWFDARVTRYRWTDASGVQREAVDAYALNTPHSRLTLVDVDAAYPGPGRSAYAVRRAQGAGREVSAEIIADWTARAEQPAQFFLSAAPTLVGLTQSITYNLTNDRMTVTARTTDIPAGAIKLLTGTINALPGTVNAL